MNFEESLDHAMVMLQRRGRLTYGTLKRQFQLDDAALEDLQNELIKGQRLAVDEDGDVLVWTGSTDVPPLPIPPAPQPGAQPRTTDAQRTQLPLPAVRPRSADAERRQLTVMFCDLVDSTALSAQLDPEDLRDVVRAYQATCAEVIRSFDGHIAQYLGDGLLVYFGYPQAHEDDAQRAVYTGLEILGAMRRLNTQLKREWRVRLAVRLGIHTGLVVVGEMGGGGRQEQLALGETPNVAARIQGLAAPDTVAISEATSRLIQGYFVCHDLGSHLLKGLTAPMQVYRILGESGVQSRLEVASARGLTPLVGRESEVALLLERWEHVKDGTGQVVLLSGEAGIGKSRLVQALQDQVAPEAHTRIEYRCSPYHQHSALSPIILRSEVSEARAHAERALAVSREHGFGFREVLATIFFGWVLVMQEQAAEGLPQMIQAIAAYRATGAEAWRHYWLALLAEAYGKTGQIEEGLTALAEALALVDKNGERFYEAELHRLKGELLLSRSLDNHAEVESSFHAALTVARHQQAKSLELRATMSLSRLWQQQGKGDEVRELLAPIYGWFTEGFNTTDLLSFEACQFNTG